MKLLFITWDGPGTTYHETLFIPLLRRAAGDGDEISLLQFSWGAEERVERLASLARAEGIHYRHVRIRRGLGAVTLPLILMRAIFSVRREVAAGRLDTIMARSMIPGGLAVLVQAMSRRNLRFIYDADGLSADERLEFGGWTRWGFRYRLFRQIERSSVRCADAVTTRTSRATEILMQRARVGEGRFVVVVNGKNPAVFRPADGSERLRIRKELGVAHDQPLLVYVGSVGPQYEPEFMFRTFRAVLRLNSNSHLLVLTSSIHHEWLLELAPDLGPDKLHIQESSPERVPELLGAADIGLAYRRPTFSQAAVAPIKVAEYLLCGLPVVYSAGVGDLDEQLDDRTAMATSGTDDLEAERVAAWIVEEALPQRDERGCASRAVGLERFSLEAGAAGYRRAFEIAGRG